ncbi:hypothetical protein ACRCUN_00405 [Mycobacterium sp. LTG2003]
MGTDNPVPWWATDPELPEFLRAQDQYDNAVLAGREAGLSWGEIGQVLGVSKQTLHSRFRARDHST